MTALFLKELWGRRSRLANSLAAVFLGVTFLTGTLVLSDTLAASVDGHLSRAYAGTGVTVRDFLETFHLVLGAFGGAALLGAALSIYNTFAITLAQRVREVALLRAVGAGHEQVVALVAAEAAVIGSIAAVAGIAAGVGCAALLKTLFAEFGEGLPAQGLVITPGTVALAAAAGLLVTLAAALGPAVRAARVGPLTALREDAAEPAGLSESRVIIGAALGTVAGGAVLIGALSRQVPLTVAGSVMSVAVMVVLGPVAARPAIVLAGGAVARLRGAPGLLARENAARSPRRTAGAAAALMLGVGVVTLLTVLTGSLRTSLSEGVAGSFQGRLVVNGGSGALTPRLAEDAARLPVQDRAEYIAAQLREMDAFLSLVYAMLALAIVIALLGIANTLSLSVHERAREFGLLRAVGATRGQLRSMVRWESVIVALFGTFGGIGLGLFLGWALTRAMDGTFDAPVLPLAAIALAGAGAGILAAVRPAHRAARLAAPAAASAA